MRDGFVRGAAAIVALRGSGILLAFSMQVVLARLMTTRGYGLYAYLFSLLVLFIIPAKLGADIAAVRFVSEYTSSSGRRLLRPYLTETVRLLAKASLLASVVWGMMIMIGFLTPGGVTRVDAVLLMASVPAFAFLRFAEGALRGAGRLATAFAPYAVYWPVAVVGLAGAVKLFVGELGLTSVLAIQAGAFVVLAAYQGYLLSRLAKTHTSGANAYAEDRARWRRATVVLGLYSAFALVLGQIDVVVVGVMEGSTSAGLYAAAWRASSLVGGLLIAFNLLLAPRVARLWAEGDANRLQELLDYGFAVVALGSTVVTLLVLLFRVQLLSLFGNDFVEASGVMVVLSLGQLANVTGGPVALLLNMTGHERDSAVVLGVMAVVNLALNVLLIDRYGMAGAAWGTGACTIVWNFLLGVLVWRRLGLFPLRSWSRVGRA